MIDFNFLREPLLPSARFRIPPDCIPGSLALVTALIVVAASWSIEQVHVAKAVAQLTRAQSTYTHVLERAKRGRVASVHAKELLSLDVSLSKIRASGNRVAFELAAIAMQLPRTAWLTSITPDTRGVQLSGETDSASTVAAVLDDLSGSRFGGVSLARVSRIDRPKRRPLLAFVAVLGNAR